MSLVFTLRVPYNQWEFRRLNRNLAINDMCGSGDGPWNMISLSCPLKRSCRLVFIPVLRFSQRKV